MTSPRASRIRATARAVRRPLVLAVIALALDVAHHVLLRAMAHGHVAHVLLGTGNAAPPGSAAALAVSLVVIRFVLVILGPGLVLAALAEIVAYLLVGPKGTTAPDR